MKKLQILFLLATFSASSFGQIKEKYLRDSVIIDPRVDTWIDNNDYWRKMAELGLVKVIHRDNSPWITKYLGSKIDANMVSTTDSPDIRIGGDFLTQSENSVFIDPNNINTLVVSVNTGNNFDIGNGRCASSQFCIADYNIGILDNEANMLWSNYNCVQNNEVLPDNRGDPSTVVSNSGTRYFGYITASGGQGVSFTEDEGENWNHVVLAKVPSFWEALLDKNHLWIDNSTTSPFKGYLYDAWLFHAGQGGSGNDNRHGEIQLYCSKNGGGNWGEADYYGNDNCLSRGVNAGNHNQGVNIQTGPNGEVYAVWAIYDTWVRDEDPCGPEVAYGFSKTEDIDNDAWDDARRIIQDIKGIRCLYEGAAINKNSWPSMTVDNSNGLYRGAIYIVFAQRKDDVSPYADGYEINIYLVKSVDKGETWSEPIQINEEEIWSEYHEHSFFPWISCDPETGILSVVFYKGAYESSGIVTKASNSNDGGETWEEFQVSDNYFTPKKLGGWKNGYFGDYLGIAARCGQVYPTWSANLLCEGSAESYVSPYQIGEEDLYLPESISGVFAESQIYFAQRYIFAAGEDPFVVGEDTRTTLTSGNAILLKPGFHSVEGSVLSVFNCNCRTEKDIKDANANTQNNNTLEEKGLMTGDDVFQVKLFPNPTSYKIEVEINMINGNPCSYQLFLINGQLIASGYSNSGKSFSIDLSNLPNSIYYLKVVSGKDFFVEKIIKQ